jgi:hypothetical protein
MGSAPTKGERQWHRKPQRKITPNSVVYFAPEGEKTVWSRVGVIWGTKNADIDRIDIGLIPLEALASGQLRLMVRKFEPRQETGA